MRSVAIVWPKCKIYSFKRVSPCLVFVVLSAVGTAAHFAGTPGYARPGAPPLSHVQHPTCRSCTQRFETALTMQRASMQVSLQSAVLLKSPGERLLITHKEDCRNGILCCGQDRTSPVWCDVQPALGLKFQPTMLAGCTNVAWLHTLPWVSGLHKLEPTLEGPELKHVVFLAC